MTKPKPEEIVSLATLFAVELAKGKTIKDLTTIKTFYSTLANNLQQILLETINQQ